MEATTVVSLIGDAWSAKTGPDSTATRNSERLGSSDNAICIARVQGLHIPNFNIPDTKFDINTQFTVSMIKRLGTNKTAFVI